MKINYDKIVDSLKNDELIYDISSHINDNDNLCLHIPIEIGIKNNWLKKDEQTAYLQYYWHVNLRNPKHIVPCDWIELYTQEEFNTFKFKIVKKDVIIDKPWGWEKWKEQNENYILKELFMKEGHSCSLQYHELKHETFYVLKGKLRFYVGKTKDELEIMELNVGESYTIEPLVVHRMEAIVDSLYLELSTNHLDDVIRLEDKYGRI